MKLKMAADWVAKKLISLGIDNVNIYPTKRHPIVFGEWLKAGESNPTVLVYGHYDVQPAEPLDKWDTDPLSLKSMTVTFMLEGFRI